VPKPDALLTPEQGVHTTCDAAFTRCSGGRDVHEAKLVHVTALKAQDGLIKQRECTGNAPLPARAVFSTSVDIPLVGKQTVRMQMMSHEGRYGVANVTGLGAIPFSCPSTRFSQWGQMIRLLAGSCAALSRTISLSDLRFCSGEKHIHATVRTPFNNLHVVAEQETSSKGIVKDIAAQQVPGLGGYELNEGTCPQPIFTSLECTEQAQRRNLIGTILPPGTQATEIVGAANNPPGCVMDMFGGLQVFTGSLPAGECTHTSLCLCPVAGTASTGPPPTNPTSPSAGDQLEDPLSGIEAQSCEAVVEAFKNAGLSDADCAFEAQATLEDPPGCNIDHTAIILASTCASLFPAMDHYCAAVKECASSPPSTSTPAPSGDSSSCFGSEASMVCRDADCTKRTLMTELKAGDVVATAHGLERVVVNQHKAGSHMATLLKIETAGAAITVTPDHVILVDGRFVPAEQAVVGASLSAGVITKVSTSHGGIVNPVTPSGTVLVVDKNGGEAVVASTHPAWIANLFLEAPTFPFLASRLASYFAPASTQIFYQATEEAIAHAVPYMKRADAALPKAAFPLGIIAADVVFSLGVAVHALAMPLGVAGIVTVLVTRVK